MVKEGELIKIIKDDYDILGRELRYKVGDIFEVAIACNSL